MIDLNKVAEECDKYSRMREENGAFPKNDSVLKHCAGELIEAVEAENWLQEISNVNYKWGKDDIEQAKNDYADELMDVMYCVLVLCKRAGINPEKALLKNIEKNRKRAEKKGDKI